MWERSRRGEGRTPNSSRGVTGKVALVHQRVTHGKWCPPMQGDEGGSALEDIANTVVGHAEPEVLLGCPDGHAN